MPFQVTCPHCHGSCRVKEEQAGATVRCPHCTRQFVVAAPGARPPPPVSKPTFRLEIGVATSAGRVRTQNEDSYLIQHLAACVQNQRQEVALAIVADGAGGHQKGDLASGLAVRAMGQALAPLLLGILNGQFSTVQATALAESLDYALREANRAVHSAGQKDAAARSMAAASVAALVWHQEVVIAHVGDCRAYHAQNARLLQLTRDQTLVNRMVELGQLTEAEARTHPARGELLQALGRRGDIEPALYRVKLAPGEWLLLACDGLHSQISADDLQDAVSLAFPSAGHLADHLVELANEAGGQDNVTVVAIRCY